MKPLNFFLIHILSSSSTRAGNYQTTTMQYQSTALTYSPPDNGERVDRIECISCGQQVQVSIRSSQRIWLMRLIGLVPIAAGALLGWLFGIVLWEKLSEGLRSVMSIGFIALIVWGLIMLTRSDETLAFKVDKLHASSHRILYKPKQ